MGQRWLIPAQRQEMTWPETPGVMIADTVERCRDALRILKAQSVVGVDVESYGIDPRKEHARYHGKAISVQFAGETGPAVFVPLWTVEGVNDEGFIVNPSGREHLLDVFGEWLEEERLTKVLHNGKFDQHVLANHGVMMSGILGDTLIMDYFAFNGEQLHGLKECMRRYFKEKNAHDYGDVFREHKALKKPRLDKATGKTVTHGKQTYVPSLLEVIKKQSGVDKLVEYSVKDPKFTVKLYHHLKAKLQSLPWVKQEENVLNYFDFYEKVARPYSAVIFDMEYEGCLIDEDKLNEINSRIGVDIEEAEREFLHLCVNWGVKPSQMETFNMNSGAQVSELLYGQMGMKCEKLTKNGKKGVSKTALEAIVAKKDNSRRAARNAEIVEAILKHRSKSTLRKMFINKLVQFVPRYHGKVHSNFKQHGTQTGRLSSATPNLENIPANKKDEEYQLRSLFIAPPGYVVADIDLKQIEIRIMADLTKDPVLLALLNNGWDQHLIAMCMLFPDVREFMGATYVDGVVTFSENNPPNEEAGSAGKKKFGESQWNEWRRRAKVLNFGVSYGMGPQGFANQIGGGATVEEGKIAIAAYFKGFKGLEQGIKHVKRKCHQFGYVKTILKRYCMIPAIHSQDHPIRAAAERQAFNYVVQGSAADLIMLGMLLCWIDERLRRWGVKIVNQIHDEIVFIVKKKYLEQAKPIIEEYVSHPYHHTERVLGFKMKGLVVDTPADLGCGRNWMKAKK